MSLELATIIQELLAALRRTYSEQRVADDLDRALAAYVQYWMSHYFTADALREMIEVVRQQALLEQQRLGPANVAAADALVSASIARCLRDAGAH